MKNLDVQPIRRKTHASDFLIIFLAYCLSQVFFWSAGGRFDPSLINFTMHLLDPVLLKTRLVESLWYLHMQPPLFNLFTGIGLKLFPQTYAVFFAVFFFLLGLGLAWAIFHLCRDLGVSRPLSLAATVAYVIGPADMFYRNWYFYSYPVMVMLVTLSLLLYSYLSDRNWIRGGTFFSLMAVLMLTRYSYHLIWFLTVVAGLVLLLRNDRARIIRMATVPILIVLFWMGKNYYLFGTFSLSTWLGWSLSKVSNSFLTKEEFSELRSQDKVSYLAGIWPGNRYEQYDRYLATVATQRHPAPALSQRYKSTGSRNYNYLDWIPISQRYAQDSLVVIRYRPRAYLRGIGRAGLLYFMPTIIFPAGEDGGLLAAYHRVWEVLGGCFGRPAGDDPDLFRVLSLAVPRASWLVVFFYIMAPAVFVADLVRERGLARMDRDRLITIGFMLFNLIYVSATGILLDYGENNRFRAEIVPLSVVLAAVFLQRFLDSGRGQSGNWGDQA